MERGFGQRSRRKARDLDLARDAYRNGGTVEDHAGQYRQLDSRPADVGRLAQENGPLRRPATQEDRRRTASTHERITRVETKMETIGENIKFDGGKLLNLLARPEGFEPPTLRSEV